MSLLRIKHFLLPIALAVVSLAATGSPPNVIIVLADDLGYGDPSSYGHPSIKTPHIDQLAAEGQRWTNFYSASSVCTPSRGALLTGRYPVRLGLETHPDYPKRMVFFPDSAGGMALSEVTIAELLKERGYATALIGKWHLGHLPEYLPTRQGFDEYYGIPYSNDMDAVGGWTWDKLFLPPDHTQWRVPILEGEREVERPADQRTLTRRYTQRAVAFIEQNHKTPFFLFLSHAMPHVPLFASDDFLGKSAAGLYGDTVEELDWSVGEVVKTLRHLNIAENTLVVFSSDNGPWLRLRELAGSAGMLKDGKGTTWEGGMRVPGIFWWPGVIAPALVGGIGSQLDLMPTIAELVGVQPPTDRVIDGIDLSATLKTGRESPRRDLMFYRRGEVYAIRSGNLKLHRTTETAYRKDTRFTRHKIPLLFDLGSDPGEQFDIADHMPKKLARISAIIDKHAATVEPVENRLIKKLVLPGNSAD